MSKQIVILQRGWVVAGDIEIAEDDEHFIISNAVVIRRWGTTKGIGQLALDGPQEDTILDPAGTVTAHKLAIIAAIDIQNPDRWN